MGTAPTPTVTGKTNQRWTRVFVDGYDLSGLARSIQDLGVEFALDDVTGWADAMAAQSLGHPDVFCRGLETVFAAGTDLATSFGGSFPVLKDTGEADSVVSFIWGVRQNHVVGDPAFLSVAGQHGFSIGANVIQANWTKRHDPGTLAAFGFALTNYRAAGLTATTNYDSIDLGSSHAAGALAHLHVVGSSSGNFSFLIQQSATGAFAGEETTAHTFTANGSAAAAETADIASLSRYIRLRAVRTAGTSYIACVLALK